MPESWVKRTIEPRIEEGAGRDRSPAEVPSDFLAPSLRERASAPSPTGPDTGLPPKVLGLMAMTTVLTFATLTTGYQIFFSHSVFA